MPTPVPTIDVIAPINPAMQRVKTMLFAPFDLSKWLAVGFGAWLAYLGEGWSGSNFNMPPRHRGRQGDLEDAWRYIIDNLGWLVPLAAFGVLVGLAVWLLFTWLSSRGHFMFLNSVARDTPEIADPWRRYSRQGDSLFLFRIVLAVAGFVFCLPVIVAGVLSVVAMWRAGRVTAGPVMVLVAMACVLLLLVVLFLVIGKLLTDFVVPIMMLRGGLVGDGWQEFMGLVRAHAGAFLVYLLFQIVIKIATTVLVLLLVLGTCCVAGCLFSLPYIGTVCLLPVLVFERAYSAYYLAQFGLDYDLFALSAPPAAAGSVVPPTAPTQL